MALLLFAIASGAAGEVYGQSAVASKEVVASVRRMLEEIPSALAQRGPTGWLQYFEDSPQFLMAADGKLQLDGIEAARRFLKSYAASMQHVELNWTDIRIDPVSPSAVAGPTTGRS